MNMFGRLKRKVLEYEWVCIECKTCEVCLVKGDDVSRLFA